MAPHQPASQAEVAAFIASEFPQTPCVVQHVAPMTSTVLHPIGHGDLRPGGSVSGPTLMGVADVALYVAILGTIGIQPMAVTTSLNINFLRRPRGDLPVVGECRLIKVGKTLAVGEVTLYSQGWPEPVAHAVGTYALPPG
ncbi:MAG: hypothetical protein RI907_1970 [Pseudomonadota bacterium]|jgi:acyl-coenzyme A thioesterase PaaI-like protein